MVCVKLVTEAGRPTAKIIPSSFIFIPNSRGSTDNPSHFAAIYQIEKTEEQIYPIIVAIAAPAAPSPRAKMNIGSRMIFTTAPSIDAAIDAFGCPTALIRFDGTRVKMMKVHPKTIYL